LHPTFSDNYFVGSLGDVAVKRQQTLGSNKCEPYGGVYLQAFSNQVAS